MSKSRQNKKMDGVDEERFEGIFLPPEMHLNRDREKDLKGFLLKNIETMLDEIMGDIDDKN